MANELVSYKSGGMTAAIENGGMLYSYDRADLKQAVALYMAVQGSDFSLDDMVGETIEVEHVVAHRATMVDKESGELIENTRTVLIAPDGLRYATRSETVRTDLERALAVFGVQFPLKPALRFKVVKIKRKIGPGGYLQLVPEITFPVEGGQ